MYVYLCMCVRVYMCIHICNNMLIFNVYYINRNTIMFIQHMLNYTYVNGPTPYPDIE